MECGEWWVRWVVEFDGEGLTAILVAELEGLAIRLL
jgi:hypothetical protein